jgi:TolB-like protein/Tfp pilus assembly protein PilF
MALWAEVRRRGIVKVGIAYLALAWLAIQVAATVLPAFGAPVWALRAVIVAFVIGFPIALILAWRYELTSQGVQRDPGPAATTASAKPRGRVLDFSIIAVLVLALAVLVVDRYLIDEAHAVESIAVLPLANLSGDHAQDYFADGMTDALITNLARLRALKVVSRASVMRYKDTELSLPEIAAELGVTAILAGSAVYDGGRVRISAQLIDAASDQHLWADSYDRPLEDVLALQSDVALDIAREVSITLTPDEEARLLATRRVNPETYEDYLRGMYYLHSGRLEDVPTGLGHLRAAVDRDPGDPLAYAGLAFGYVTVSHAPAPPDDAFQLAQAAALRAVNLDPNLAEAYAALADVKYYYEWDFKGAEQAFTRAFELNPNLAMNHYHYAWYLAMIGRLDEGIVYHKRARELDPMTPLHTAWLGSLYVYRGDYDAAIAEAEQSLELDPDYPTGLFVLGTAYVGKGMFEEAIRAHEKLVEIAPPWRAMLGATYAFAGRDDDARRILEEIKQDYARFPSWGAVGAAVIHAALGEADEAAEWLAHEPHHAWTAGIAVDPLFNSLLQGHPTYEALLARLDLPKESCCYRHSLFGTTH